jgi:hypothetical protein
VASLLDEISPAPRTRWRARVMNHVLEKTDDELHWIAELAKTEVPA